MMEEGREGGKEAARRKGKERREQNNQNKTGRQKDRTKRSGRNLKREKGIIKKRMSDKRKRDWKPRGGSIEAQVENKMCC